MLARGNRMTFRKWEMTFFVLLKNLKNSRGSRFLQISGVSYENSVPKIIKSFRDKMQNPFAPI